MHHLLKGKFHTDSDITAPLYPMAASAATKSAKSTESATKVTSKNITELAEDILHRESASAKSATSGCSVYTCVSETVITALLVGIAEHIISLGSLLELLLSFSISRVFVGMILDGHFPVGLLYFVCRGFLAYAKHLIVISFCHN